MMMSKKLILAVWISPEMIKVFISLNIKMIIILKQ